MKKNILRIAISVFYIGENDNRQTKNCYNWKHKYTREGDETLLRNPDNIDNDQINNVTTIKININYENKFNNIVNIISWNIKTGNI